MTRCHRDIPAKCLRFVDFDDPLMLSQQPHFEREVFIKKNSFFGGENVHLFST